MAPHARKRSVTPISTSPPAPERYPVVVVEDDTAIRQLLGRYLSAQGYLVTATGDADEALAKLKGLDSPIVVTDRQLPGQDGLALVATLRATRDDFEAVLVTAFADVDGLSQAMQLGVFACVRKPFELPDVLGAVSGAANRLFLRLDRRKRARELEARNSELETALARLKESETKRMLSERLASLGRFAASLNHELNNPLAYVHANVSLLASGATRLRRAIEAWVAGRGWGDLDGDLREDVARYVFDLPSMLEESEKGLALMRQISSDLGSVSRYRSDSIEVVDLNEVVSSACRVACVEPRLRDQLEIDLASQPIRVRGNAGRLAQVIMNLVANAAEAGDPERPNHVRVSTAREGASAVLAVSDTGIGIPSERVESIFEPFVTFRSEEGGSGIGLDIVKEIVSEHGGVVEVDSAVGQGSCFRVKLPVVTRASTAPRSSTRAKARSLPRTSRRPALPQGALRLLFVDDDAAIRRVMTRAFSRRHHVRVADSGVSALRAIELEAPDVVVTDLMMPEMDGVTLFEQIAARWPALAHRVVMISGTHALIREARRRAPSLPLLTKPFAVEELERTIREVSAA